MKKVKITYNRKSKYVSLYRWKNNSVESLCNELFPNVIGGTGCELDFDGSATRGTLIFFPYVGHSSSWEFKYKIVDV